MNLAGFWKNLASTVRPWSSWLRSPYLVLSPNMSSMLMPKPWKHFRLYDDRFLHEYNPHALSHQHSWQRSVEHVESFPCSDPRFSPSSVPALLRRKVYSRDLQRRGRVLRQVVHMRVRIASVHSCCPLLPWMLRRLRWRRLQKYDGRRLHHSRLASWVWVELVHLTMKITTTPQP